jgi:hypothetical protein
MAKHVIPESYTFNPTTKTVVVNGKNIRREQLLLITNVTRNTVIYNFSDPNLNATSYTNSISTGQQGFGSGGLEVTTIILNYNTAAMASTDKLSILVEETYHEVTPAESQLDPVGKMRVSEPQSLIDTDFEYGIQPTKWESITLVENRPSAYYNVQGAIALSNITGSFQSNTSVLVACPDTVTPGLTIGIPIFVQGTLDAANADGWAVIETLSANSSFTFRTTGVPAWALYDPTKTYVFSGQFYSNAAITVNNVYVMSNVIYVSTTNAHGLQPGNGIWLNNLNGVAKINGPWTIATTPLSNTFTANAYEFANAGVDVNALRAGALGASAGFFSNVLYSRPTSYIQHRAYDGGVQFTAQNPSPGVQVIRQTRRYFRYQSGKAVQFSTGSILKPALSIDSLTAVGTTITINCRQTHGLGVGANITVTGANETAYNGTFTVTSVPNPLTLTYTASSSPTATPASGFPIIVSPSSWYGSRTRIGMFDQQNGFFFEFDGQTIYAVKRTSTQQLSGSVTVTLNSPIVTGTNTRFSAQLTPGDYIVIRGMSYMVQSIISDTSLIIAPEYRGTSATRCLVSKTIDTKVPQSQWNIDTCDGNGHSLYNLDLSKMQMFYIDYSWYGAGAIRFGFKNNRGEVIYCHRITNNNLNTEAYMRSGNMCARYETNTLPPYTILTSTLSSAATTGATISVADASLFPNIGTVMLTASGNQSAPIEFISYSAKSANALTIASRALFGGVTSANTFTFSSTAPIQVSLSSAQNASTVSHWGSAVIMDGKYDDDKSLVFNIGQNNPLINLPINQRYAVMSLRVAPSVDNGFVGQLGAREIVNRMQLVLRQMDTLTTGPYRIDVILNGNPTSGFWSSIGGSSLAQYSLHANATPIVGGENIFSFFTNAGGATQQDMTLVRDLGTSILGGGQTNYANTLLGKYPDGPDIITICATPLALTSNINARISWTEAQA